MRRSLTLVLVGAAIVATVPAIVVGCGGGNRGTLGIFDPQPECQPATLLVNPLSGSRQMVVSSLAIAKFNEGFDLNGDGKPDNLLSPLGALANEQILSSFQTRHDIVLPLELFGYNGADSDCTKFAFYLGRVKEDRDTDGWDTTWEPTKSDCDDTDPKVNPRAAKTANRMDNDCDGKAADEGSPDGDLDGDGYKLSDGDCDDRNDPDHIAIAKARHPGATEICGNGIDDDCNGIADDGANCDPYGENDLPVHVQALSFSNANADGWADAGVPDDHTIPVAGLKPMIVFPDGKVQGGVLNAGPDLFKLDLNIQGISLTLTLTGAHARLTLVDKPNGAHIVAGILGGVLQDVSLAQIHIDAGGVLHKEQSLLDGIFVGPAGTILGLTTDADGHYLPDIDVDGDGLETFWQSETTGPVPDGGTRLPHIDTCKDGDGSIVHNGDNGVAYCPLSKNPDGSWRFVDGLSAALKFNAVPAKLMDVTVK
jgi:hypothetical protein